MSQRGKKIPLVTSQLGFIKHVGTLCFWNEFAEIFKFNLVKCESDDTDLKVPRDALEIHYLGIHAQHCRFGHFFNNLLADEISILVVRSAGQNVAAGIFICNLNDGLHQSNSFSCANTVTLLCFKVNVCNYSKALFIKSNSHTCTSHFQRRIGQ